MIGKTSAAVGACVVSLALALGASAALAQQKAGEPAKTTAPKPAAKPKSPCQGLDEAKCKADAQCRWVNAKKRKPYCSKIPEKKK